MKKFHLFPLLVLFISFSAISLGEQLKTPKEITAECEEEEALFLRRLSEFWEEGEYNLVKTEIELFLKQNTGRPQNIFYNYLFAFLGDVYVQEKNFKLALDSYEKIDLKEFKERTKYNFLQCLYEMQHYSEVVKEAKELLKDKNLKKREREDLDYLCADSLFKMSKTANEGKLELAKSAKKAFEELLESEYQKEALIALTELDYGLKDFKAPAERYLLLSSKFPEMRDEFLFQAGLYYSECDKEKAVKIFSDLWSNQKKKSAEALYNRMLILFEEEKYQNVIDDAQTLLQNFSSDKSLFLNFFLGKSYFKLGKKDKAREHYLAFVAKDQTHMAEMKIALNDLMSIGSEQKDADLFNRAFSSFESLFAKDEAFPEYLLEKAQFCADTRDFENAQSEFEKIEKDFDKFSCSENFLFEHAKLYYQMEKWEASRARFKKFLEKYPESNFAPAAWRYYINSSINNLSSSSPEDVTVDKQYLTIALEKFLAQAKATEGEFSDYLYLLGQVKFSLKDYDEAIVDLQKLCSAFPKHPNLSDAFLLLAFAYKNQYKDVKNFQEYAAKALEADPGLLKNPNIQLALFNGFADFVLKNPRDETLTNAAADSLFTAYRLKAPIKASNLFWLSDHFRKKALCKPEKDKQRELLIKRAISLKNKGLDLMRDAPKDVILEEEILKLAQLYQLFGKEQKSLNCLSKLANLYLLYPEAKWQNKGRTSFYLAKGFEAKNDLKKAQFNYGKAIEFSSQKTDFLAEALLKKTRLDLVLLEQENRRQDHPEIIKSLSNLQLLILQKDLNSEPCHLEAALEYVDLQCFLGNDKNEEKRLFLLSKMKDLFSKEEDIPSKDYHAKRRILDQQNKLFMSYMQMIEIEILISKAALEKDKDAKKAAEYKTLALAMVKAFQEKDLTATQFLQKRIERKLKTMEAL